jgi:phosphate transport system substrate-binding protein
MSSRPTPTGSSRKRSRAIAEALRTTATLAAAAACVAVGAAGVDPELPAYVAQPVEVPRDAAYVSADGRIRVVGYNDMKEMLEAMATRFTPAHPHIRFELVLPGTRFAPEALAKGASAFAPMGAELTPAQLAAYRAIRAPDPVVFRIAHASLDPRALSGPLAIFVHRDNPVRSLTLAQVARIFAGEARRWGDVGAQGEWAARPITTVGLADGTALFYAFRDMAMGARPIDARMAGLAQSADVVRKVGEDLGAIGFAAAMRATEATRLIALAARAGDTPVAPTEENIVAGRYPLDRFLLIAVARPVTPLAREFLRLALSRDGQEAVAATPQRYLPLSAADAAAELRKLERHSYLTPFSETVQPAFSPHP